MTTSNWDVIIVGGGVAGLSAALTLGRSRRRTLVIDAGQPRNRFAAHAHGILALDGTPPFEILARGRSQAADYGVEFLADEVTEVTNQVDGIRVVTAGGDEFQARALIVATGMTDALPAIPGLREHWGRAVLHCPYCHGWEVRDRRLGVLVLNEMGFHQAQLIRQWSEDVTMVVADGVGIPTALAAKLTARGVRIVQGTVSEVVGDGESIDGIRMSNGELVPLDALFTFGEVIPHDDFTGNLALERNETPMGSFISVNDLGETSVERVWAIGNVVKLGAAIPQAAGDGMFTAAQVNMWLVNEDFDLALERTASPKAHWEHRYQEKPAMWSGNPNTVLVDIVRDLRPGTALDLGCGEGADVIWLAQQGWQAFGIDISQTAISRAQAVAVTAGLDVGQADGGGRAVFRQVDLAEQISLAEQMAQAGEDAGLDSRSGAVSTPEQFDLVSASFLHSTVELPRIEILRRMSEVVNPGGHLLITSHAAPPPWAKFGHDGKGHHHDFLTPQQEIDALALPGASWSVVIAETRARAATGPDGQVATLEDGVVLLRREA